MSVEIIFQAVLILAAFLYSLTAGFLLGFAIVAMPGIGNFKDPEYIHTFQVTDRIIENSGFEKGGQSWLISTG